MWEKTQLKKKTYLKVPNVSFPLADSKIPMILRGLIIGTFAEGIWKLGGFLGVRVTFGIYEISQDIYYL